MSGKNGELQTRAMDLNVYNYLKFKREEGEMERSKIVKAIDNNKALSIYDSLIRLRDREIISERKDGKKAYYRFAKRCNELEDLQNLKWI